MEPFETLTPSLLECLNFGLFGWGHCSQQPPGFMMENTSPPGPRTWGQPVEGQSTLGLARIVSRPRQAKSHGGWTVGVSWELESEK